MKILFGLNQSSDNSMEERILEVYKEKTSKSFEYKKEFDLIGIEKEITFNRYDVLVLNELLERQNTVTTDFLDDLTDKHPNLRIIFVIDSEQHEKDSYIKRLFNIGIHDIVFSHDLSIDILVNLINKGRTKAEAKVYLDLIDTDDDIVETELKYIPKEELENILIYLSEVEDEFILPTIKHIQSQYNERQMVYLIGFLPDRIKDILRENEEFNELVLMAEEVKIKETYRKEPLTEEDDEKTNKGKALPKISIFSPKNEKVKVKIEYRDRIESVFKKVITVYSPTGEGASTIAAHLAYTLASNKECKVGLLDFEIFNPIQRELFDINPNFTLKDALDAVIKKTLTPAVLENFMKNNKVSKNLDILAGLYDINEFYSSQQIYFKEIIEKAKFTYDYIVIDTNSLYDLYPTNIALEMADDVIVPLRGRKHSINTVNRYLSNFNEYNDYDIRKFYLVVNKYSGNDLTSIEIQSQAIRPIIGYISYNKNYDKLTLLNDTKTINEYIDVLNEIGIKIKKKRNIFKSIVGRQKGDLNVCK